MKKILLIEDNDDIRNNTAEILELSNYQVITAENGKIGVKLAIEQNPDLVVCDIMMPVLDGYGVIHALQRNAVTKNTPFIFLTAKTDRSDFRTGMEIGADDFITKPFTGTELLKAIDGRLKKIELLKMDFGKDDANKVDTTSVNLELDALTALTKNRDTNHYKKKQPIYSEGNHPIRIYYIIKGKLKAFKTNESGKELITELYCEGDFVGHIALLEGGVYKDSTEAIEDCELAIIPKEDFEELLSKNLKVSKKIIELLAKNVSEKENQLLGLAYNSLRRKVANALLLLLKKYGQVSEENFIIDISRDSLANIAGTATESLIRTLSDFKAEKLIDIKDGSIKIINEKKLTILLN